MKWQIQFILGGGNSGSFHINDKYTGFHAATYSTNGGNSWTNVTPKGADGYYGSAVSYSGNGLQIRFDRDKYDLVFFPDPDTNAEPITYSVPYEESLSTYGNQSPGQKEGYYFIGWYADDAHSQLFDFNTTMPDHNVSVFGYWRMERIRAVFVPGADNVYIDPSQALTFRVDYDERISGAMLEAATRTGYTLDGWYTDPNFTNKFLFSTPINSSTVGVDMTYQTSPNWAAARAGYGDDDENNSNVRGILVLYAKWIVNTSEKGVNIVYDAGNAALYDGLNNMTTTVPVDPRLYQNGSNVIVGAAPGGYSDLYYFDYWEIVDSNGDVVTITDQNGNSISSFAPGTTFNVDAVSDEQSFSVTYDESGEALLKTIKLRAHYTKSEEAAARFTTITYDGDTLTDSIYPNGTQELRGMASDGTHRYTVTLDEEINATIILPKASDFYLDGYELVGWSFFEGTYEEQMAVANAWNTEHPSNPVIVKFNLAQEVAADNLAQNPVNNEENILYAMWQPKTYTVTVKQVIESGVSQNSFTYRYKSGVENTLSGTGTTLTMTGDDSVTYSNLTTDSTVPFQYYGRLGHVFNIPAPTIPANAEYDVRVSATVMRDNGVREPLPLNALENYEILGDVEITFTYSQKVPVTLEKRALNDNSPLTGSEFLLTPVQWNGETQQWAQIGQTTFEFDMSTVSSLTKKLQEGIYRVEETQAPTDYARMSEPLLLTVRRNEAFIVRTTTSGEVNTNIARLTGSDSHTLTIYDRPIREVTVRKIVDGQDLETAGYTFSVQLTLEGSPMRSYDTVGSGLTSDTTNSSGIIEFKLAHAGTKTLRVPWGAVIQIEENEYAQFAVVTESQNNVADAEPENNRIYRCTVDVNDTVTFTNKNVLLTVTKEVTGGYGDKTQSFFFTLGGLTTGKVYRVNVAGSAVTRTADVNGQIDFELKHNQTMTIPLIQNANYTVTEAQVEGYTTSLRVDEGDLEEERSKTITLDAAKTIAYENYYPPVAPTGVSFNTRPFVWMLLLGSLLLTGTVTSGFLRRKREWGDEDD